MGGIVKSIGRALGRAGKSIGRMIKKIAPVLLLAAAVYMGTAAFGSMGAAASQGGMFSWGNFTSGIGKIGGAFGMGGAAQAPLAHGAMTAADMAVGAKTGITAFIRSAFADSPALALMTMGNLIGGGFKAIGALMEVDPQDKWEEEIRQFNVQNTYGGYGPPGSGIEPSPDLENYWSPGPSFQTPSYAFEKDVRQMGYEPSFGRQRSMEMVRPSQPASAALASRPAQSAQPGLISQGTTNQTRLV
tara:strand:+ start:4047 stop:4781 length:735 start_codon:yes stop_codon:yes gene_type:complete